VILLGVALPGHAEIEYEDVIVALQVRHRGEFLLGSVRLTL
jgi:hypothetical protein